MEGWLCKLLQIDRIYHPFYSLLRVFSTFSNISLELRWKGTNSMDTELWIRHYESNLYANKILPWISLHSGWTPVSHGFMVYNDGRRLQNTKIVGKKLDVKRWFGRNSGKPMPEEFFVSVLDFRSSLPTRFFLRPTLLKTFIIDHRTKVGNTALRPTNQTIPRNKWNR